jgi:predicted membrane-bound spermidine synthase
MKRLAAVFFLSGAVGLAYETVWTRLFAGVLGSTALSMVVVFSSFLLALATGAWLFGKSASRGRAAVALYGVMEIAIGVTAAGAGALLLWGRTWLISEVPATGGFFADTAVHMVVCLALTGVPTLLMGGTLPVLMNGVRAWTLPQKAIGWLYGWNTMGGAAGALATGFFLIWQIGVWGTLLAGAAANVVVGIVALAIARNAPAAEAATAEPAPAREPLNREGLAWLGLAFSSGFVVLASEVLWGRMARFLLGDRTLAVSYLLFVFLIALGAGSMLAPLVGRRFGGGRAAVGAILLAAAAVQSAAVLLARGAIGGGMSAGGLAGRLVLAWLLIAPPAVALGLTFPLLAWSARQLNDLPGRVIGSLYFVNTLGAVAGAVLAGFAVTRSIGTLAGFLALTGLQVALGALLLATGAAGTRARWIAAAALPAFGALALVHPLRLDVLRPGETLADYREDEYGVQLMTRTSDGRLRVRNNRVQLVYDLGHPQTSHAQQMAAHYTVLLADGCADVVNVGTGYGITSGAYTLYPDVRRIETVEILPFLADRQPDFAPYNFNHTADPRVRLHVGDGRHFLTASARAYDIISVNVLDPYLPGSSLLYTVDFWEEARARLKPGGAYTQLFWGQDVGLLLKGLRRVFPAILCFPAYGGTSYNVVAFGEPREPSSFKLHLSRLGPSAERELRRFSDAPPAEFLQGELRAAIGLAAQLESVSARETGRLHTDAHPILEFRWAHGAEGISIFDSPLVEHE